MWQSRRTLKVLRLILPNFFKKISKKGNENVTSQIEGRGNQRGIQHPCTGEHLNITWLPQPPPILTEKVSTQNLLFFGVNCMVQPFQNQSKYIKIWWNSTPLEYKVHYHDLQPFIFQAICRLPVTEHDIIIANQPN